MQPSNPFLSLFAQKEMQRFKLKLGVFLFLIQNQNILLLKRHQTGIDDGSYVVPMGGIEGGESLTSALIREAHEEVNIRLNPENLEVCHLMHRFHPMPQGLSFEQADVFFRTNTYEGIIENLEPNKCDELKFYPLTNLPEKTAPFIRHAIDCVQRRQFYSEFGWEKGKHYFNNLFA